MRKRRILLATGNSETCANRLLTMLILVFTI